MNVLKTLGICVAVAASLLVFPSCVPWIIFGWLLWHTWRGGRRQLGWLPLAACAAVVLVKGVYRPPALLVLAAAACLAGGLGVAYSRRSESSRRRRVFWAGEGALWLAWAWFAWDWEMATRCDRDVTVRGNRPVACLGDSLTSGVAPDYGYPKLLRRRIAWPVLDSGQQGITSGEGLKLLPKLLAARPQVVVLELGGHDYLKGNTRAATKANLAEIIRACRGIDAEVILIEVPRGLIVDPYRGLERELAREFGLELIPDTVIRELVLWSPFGPPGIWLDERSHLSDDGLHPNANGNRRLAKEVEQRLVRLYGAEIHN